MRRLPSRILAYLLSVCLIAGVFSACKFSTAVAGGHFVLSDKIYDVIDRIDELETATEKYYGTQNTFDYTTRYIRAGTYFDIKWQIMVGSPEPAYEKEMQPHAALRDVHDLLVMTDQNGKRYCVDFPHMMAVADAKKDFSGWAGDLITLAADISSLYEARLMIANEFGVFGALDMRADIDALNLVAIAKENGGSLADAMRVYYLQGGVERSVTTFLMRETGLAQDDFDVELIYESFFARLDKKSCESETLMLENMYGVTGTEKLEYVCRAFAEWLYRTHCEETAGHESIVMFVYPPSCIQNGYTCVVCRNCGRMEQKDIVPALKHRLFEKRIEPTETEPGRVVMLCEICGYSVTSFFDNLDAGDLDCNGRLDAHDYMRLKRGILGSYTFTHRQRYLADINGDNEQNAQDYMLLREWLLHGKKG